MAQNRKSVYAGRLVMECVYPVASGEREPRARAAKSRMTRAAQQRLNFKYSWEKLSAILAENFPKGSDVTVLKYDDAHYPDGRTRIEADLKAFRKRAAKEWRRRGRVFRMAWAIEHKHGDGRWHVHCVISACTGNDIALIQTLWGKGDAHTEHLKAAKDRNHITLARYMAKESEERENSRHAWHYTRNCSKPEVNVRRGCSDGEALQAPKGAIVLERESHTTEFGTWAYIKYYIPEEAPKRSQRRLKR